MFTFTESYLISNFKKQVISISLVRDVSHHMGLPKKNSKSLRSSKDKKKKNKEEEEDKRNTDIAKTTKKNGKLSRKEIKIQERSIRL